ncbi:inverse autotransporter beta domain-containing protein [Escherichia fergusonii]|uniref:inverse autotransporter beta domain-containing protein n=2 Tax=Escherichia fergusonii TaxID=564 RepID=UPI0015EA3F03|nr:inverse autotransporter beta domain-containing protein [Escherichia fergusonii]QME64443.1 inverse autotransporter beta domain-containing protein [Escherichia fergusonii]QME69052.1 inverse autotransporter beta domain-containing protein [Escherichia fergusonii]QMF00758.1 inverse autotransporter beta domain-containing protein [Escherichia fergusonii]
MNENTFRHRPLTRAVAFLCIAAQVLFPVAATASGPLRTAEPVTQPLADDDARLAGLASQAGSMLTSGVSGNQAADMARGYATGAAQAAFQEWLSQWGTARVTLSADEHFTLKGSALDLLLPWYDTPGNIIFTQHSIHRTDDRNQLNTGAGWRHFMPDYMTGVNLFFDHDLTRYHSRLGLGGEYWRDYLKLGANGYLRLTGWRDAPELDNDYEARPANGWDVRAEGYLPAYPQLGAKLMYEQYYGDEVALFGRDHRQKDPHAFTAGLSYTPVPLVSLSAEQRQGKGGENDTRFGLNLSYTPGVSLARQLDPDAVAYRRSLSGSRHDLVERNNNIVLEYRKKELVKLRLTDPVTGKGGEQKPLVASLQSKYALKTLQTDAATLTAAGGVISTTDSQVTVTLPEYRYTATPDTDNAYRVAVTAEDVKGNRSNREESTVVVQAPQLSAEDSEVTSDKTTLKPDGVDKAVLTFRAQDAEGNAVSGLAVNASFTVPDGMAILLSDTFTETETKGTYTAELKGSTPGEVSVMPLVDGKDAAKASVTVVLSDVEPVAEHSTIALSSAATRADQAGQSFRAGEQVFVTVMLKDAQQHPVSGQKALLQGETVSVEGMSAADGADWQEEDGGAYRRVYIAQGAKEGHRATLTLTGGSKTTDPYTIEPGDVNISNSTLSGNPEVIAADGQEEAVITYTALDSYKNVIDNLEVKAAVDLPMGMTIDLPDFTESAVKGTYTTTLKGVMEGEVSIMPQVDGQNAARDAVKVTLKITPDEEHSTISLENSYSSGDTMLLKATLRDKNGNALTGMAESLKKNAEVSVEHATLQKNWTESSENSGEYIAEFAAGEEGTDLKASLKWRTWNEEKVLTYYITPAEPAYMEGTITAGEKNDFPAIGDEKFPTTGFEGATFTLNSDNFSAGGGVGHYALKVTCGSDTTKACGWVTATADGSDVVVTFRSSTVVPVADRNVKITATPGAGSNSTTVLTYEFVIKKWFQPDIIPEGAFHNLATSCSERDGQIPLHDELSLRGLSVTKDNPAVREVGSLWTEWGTDLQKSSLVKNAPAIWGAQISGTEEEHLASGLEIIGATIHWETYPGSIIKIKYPSSLDKQLSRVCVYR